MCDREGVGGVDSLHPTMKTQLRSYEDRSACVYT